MDKSVCKKEEKEMNLLELGICFFCYKELEVIDRGRDSEKREAIIIEAKCPSCQRVYQTMRIIRDREP